MFSRLNMLPRFSTSIRRLNQSSQMLTKQIILTNINSDHFKKSTNNNMKQPKPSNNDRELINMKSNFKILNNTSNKKISDIIIDKDENHKKNVVLMEKFKSITSNQELIKTCQEFNGLVKLDRSFVELFINTSICEQVLARLSTIITANEYNPQEFLIIANFISNLNLKEFQKVLNVIKEVIPKFNVDQLLNILSLLRKVKLDERIDTMVLDLIANKIHALQNIDGIIKANKLFATNASVLKILDETILKLSDQLSTEQWVDILKVKSILKIRNVKIIEACAYNIAEKKIDIKSVQECFLSCGILNYRDEFFYKFLVQRLVEIVNEFKNNKYWVQDNKKNLFSIISSLGMLNLRDKLCMNVLCDLLVTNFQDSRLLINFVITCGSMNYEPKKIDDVISEIELTNFSDTIDKRQKMFLLNYVWSLCMLKRANSNFIKEVLKEDFWRELVEKESIYLKPMLIKLLNINLYTQLFVEDYDGPLLPNSINAGNYTNILKTESNSFSNTFVSTLSSYKSAEKYFKLNMLTPFGIMVDALMVIDNKSIPIPLDECLNENGQLETKNETDLKIAFKLVDFKDIIKNGNKLSGNISMQILLLNQLGYKTITLTQDDLSSSSVIQRVNLIKKKLEKATHYKDD